MNRETNLQNLIRIRLSKLGVMNFRNNTGMGWAGKATKIHKRGTFHVEPGDVIVKQARPLKAGLCEGSSDIISLTPVVITKDMIGESMCIFTAVEVKSEKGRPTKKQLHFIKKVKEIGGIAFIARSPDEAETKLQEQLQSLST